MKKKEPADIGDNANVPSDPLALFLNWLESAEEHEPADPNAMTLATVDPEGQPQARIVLLKGVDDRGFVFYTNTASRKGEALKHNPKAALNFYWKSLNRQIQVSGITHPVSDTEADAYFATRPRGSRIGAWASLQSQPLESREVLARRIAELHNEYGDDKDIPRPPHWSGYRLEPARFEFWQEAKFRLHTRLVYTPGGDGWNRHLLYP